MAPLVKAQPSFISLIPNEILLKILYTVPSAADAHPHISPVVMSHVSQLWRGLMLCSTNLWTDISIDESFSRSVMHFTATLSRVSECLQRSGNRALNIDIVVLSQVTFLNHVEIDHTFRDDYETFCSLMKNLSDILAPHVWRFMSFNLVCDEFSSILRIQRSFQHVSMPLLETWHVHRTCEELAFEGDVENIDDLTALHIPLRPRDVTEERGSSMFPQLRSAILCATPMDWSRFCPRNLHSLEISFLPTQARPHGEVLRQILLANEHCLASLKILGAAPTTNANQSYVMNKLERLELGYAFPDELIPFVEDIQLPNLVDLLIEDLYRSSTPDFARDQLEYDHTTTILFQCITEHFPLRQVTSLTLRHICLLPPLSQTSPDHNPILLIPDSSNLVIPVTPFAFFCELVMLKHLTLVGPDLAILFTLNHIPVEKETGDGDNVRATPMPAPILDFLHLEDFDPDLVRLFLVLRTTHHTSFRRLSNLSFTNYLDCVAKSDCITRSTELFLIAEAFEHITSDKFRNIQVELGVMPPYPLNADLTHLPFPV